MDFFYNQFIILGKSDVALLKDLSGQLKDKELCEGRNSFGLYYGGITNWYLGRETSRSPDCLEEKPKVVLVFNPNFGEFYKKETELFLSNGYKPLEPAACAQFWCVLVRGQATSTESTK